MFLCSATNFLESYNPFHRIFTLQVFLQPVQITSKAKSSTQGTHSLHMTNFIGVLSHAQSWPGTVKQGACFYKPMLQYSFKDWHDFVR